jgi:lon-related putative ATP-dependent protease
MSKHLTPIAPDRLFHACDPSQFDFATTEELADAGVIIGQERAMGALRMGLGIPRKGFNVFVMGPSGSGKITAAKESAAREAERRPAPDDWCYVNHFEHPAKPRALRLPAGQGRHLARDMAQLVDELSVSIPATFEGDEFRNRSEEIESETKAREMRAIEELRAEAKQRRISLVETPTGFALAPLDEEGEPLNPERFEKLPGKEQLEIQENVSHLHHRLQKLLRQFPAWRKEAKTKLRRLNQEFAEYAVSHHLDELKERYAHLPAVVEYLQRAEQDIIEHVEDFFPKSDGNAAFLGLMTRQGPLQRYRVNLLVDHGDSRAAPVVDEDLPNHGNLIGRIEHQAFMGALVTDFGMIKPGALHKANGGYLILDARKLLMQPYAWESLKRALHTGEIRVEPLEQTLGLMSTASLEPEPIPLDVKIVLAGDRLLYYLLGLYDPEFHDLFKVAADFEESLTRDADSCALYARIVAGLARREGLHPLDRAAVARVIEYASRRAEDAAKISTHLRTLNDLLKEADYLASEDGRDIVGERDIEKAVEQRIHRADRVRERIYESIRRGVHFISVDGEAVGQINGLSVISLGEFAFGQPSRITATTRLGAGKIIDIERETELGGPIHSKGVMILSSFIAARYGRDLPLSMNASLVFEQSYGMVEGDSASLAELCALLSSLSGLPIRQSLAVTGSVNQHGKVQPIGGVNEKIEGFFDVCRAIGLNGAQGVIIPSANLEHLMLRADVVDAARTGQFRVYAADGVDEAVELLFGQPAGARDEDTGQYPEGSVNAKVEARLRAMSETMRKLHAPAQQDEDKRA